MVPQGALRSARRVLESLRFSSVTPRRAIRGSQAVVCFLDALDADGRVVELVLKAFTPDHRGNSAHAVAEEFRALQAFHSALTRSAAAPARGNEALGGAAQEPARAVWGVRTPRPVALMEDAWAYLMSVLPGRPLDEALTRSGFEADQVIGRVLHGLRTYYDHVPSIYGDFQPRNLLIGDRQEVGFLDMTTPNPFCFNERFQRLAHARPASDIGYWVFMVAWRFPDIFARRVALGAALWEFSARLCAGGASLFAPGDEGTFVWEVGTVVEAHWRHAARKSRVGGRLLAVVSGRLARALLGRAVRISRSGRPPGPGPAGPRPAAGPAPPSRIAHSGEPTE